MIMMEVVSKKRDISTQWSDKNIEHNVVAFGLSFDKDLKIIKIDEKAKRYGLILGDKLLQANGMKITNQQELTQKIATLKSNSSLLFERREFQFFVNVN
jgi:hypothetical protein